MLLYYVREGEEEVALFQILETVFYGEAQFLGDARDAERLAGKTGAQNVVLFDVGYRNGMNVTMRLVPEVRFIRDPGRLIPVGGKDALAARALEGEPETANAAEEVNEP